MRTQTGGAPDAAVGVHFSFRGRRGRLRFFVLIPIIFASLVVPTSASATQGDFFLSGTPYSYASYTRHYNSLAGGYGYDSWTLDIHAKDALGDLNHPLYAPEAGTVTQLAYDSVGGNKIIWKSANGSEEILLAHLASVVKTGSVSGGDLIARIGGTGGVPPHIHMERRVNGSPAPIVLSGRTLVDNPPYVYDANPITTDGPQVTSTGPIRVVHYNPIAPGDPGFTKGGLTSGWTSIGGGYYGSGIYTYCGGSTTDNWGKWKFDLSKLNGSRKYNVDAYIPSAYHSTTKADYHIATSSGVQHKVLNQSAYSNQWADLGDYSFTSGADWMVYLDDVTGEIALSKYIALDAIRLTPYFTLTYAAGAGGTITGTATQSVLSGADATKVTAVPNAGYRFVKWSDGRTTAARTDLDVAADKTVSASFAAVVVPSVHRFYNTRLGVHFYTADEAEKANTVNNLGGTYTYEGVAYGVNPASNTQPLHRFYNRRVGVHFYTASETEKANTINTLGDTYTYEGVAYNVSAANATGRTAVHRFYNTRTGTHFYTSDEAERQNILNTLGAIYQYEGVGFYLAP